MELEARNHAETTPFSTFFIVFFHGFSWVFQGFPGFFHPKSSLFSEAQLWQEAREVTVAELATRAAGCGAEGQSEERVSCAIQC